MGERRVSCNSVGTIGIQCPDQANGLVFIPAQDAATYFSDKLSILETDHETTSEQVVPDLSWFLNLIGVGRAQEKSSGKRFIQTLQMRAFYPLLQTW